MSEQFPESIALPVFTTRVDTVFGVSFVSVAPESPIADQLLPQVPDSKKKDVESYIAHVKSLSKDDRANGDTTAGVFTGVYATHPLTGAKVPIYLAEYVLSQYGTGVVMGVPAHDSRDFAFAQHHDLEIRAVIAPKDAKSVSVPSSVEDMVTEHGVLHDSGEFSGLSSQEAATKINAKLTAEGIGAAHTQFRLRDWLVSRQRYWGTPVPVVHCASCGPVGVPTEDLPVALPPMGENLADDLRGGDGQSPLARMQDWTRCQCPKCGGPAERDTDTLDTFVDSSWYFMRYCDARNDKEPFSKDAVRKWMKDTGVDLYVGGIEHAILHLLYSRFLTKFLYDQKMLATDEPFAQLLAQGMVLGRTHKSPTSLRCLKPDEVSVDAEGRVLENKTGQEVVTVWEKMSKSKYNGVEPEAIRSKHGADVTRLVVLFKAPPAHELEWDEADLAGQSRWIARIWALLDNAIARGSSPSSSDSSSEENDLRLQLHGTIKRVTDALDQNQSFNVAIAELMKLSNYLGDVKHLNGSRAYHEALQSLVTMLAPLAPHSAAEMFETLHAAGLASGVSQDADAVDIHTCAWPIYDAELLARAQVKIVLQVQGKARDTILVPSELQGDQEKVLQLAMESAAIQRHLQGKNVRRAILIPPKKQGAHGLLNIVV